MSLSHSWNIDFFFFCALYNRFAMGATGDTRDISAVLMLTIATIPISLPPGRRPRSNRVVVVDFKQPCVASIVCDREHFSLSFYLDYCRTLELGRAIVHLPPLSSTPQPLSQVGFNFENSQLGLKFYQRLIWRQSYNFSRVACRRRGAAADGFPVTRTYFTI